ncbi:MAG: 30S ribosomal protein S20 [Clostridiaceae bacterium]|nr:30S ribosomal protein S20 [Eubacteriales bacterium]NLV48224.1 30S ribosomal protein S20 [Clostridiaceae bacterium]
MPNIKSAIKRTRTIARKTAANKMQKSKIRTLLKKTQSAEAAAEGRVLDLARQTQKMLDQAAAKGHLHKNNVARKKSRLAKAIQTPKA